MPDRITIELVSDKDIVRARRQAADALKRLGASPLRQTRIMTAVSEIARNALIHGNGGSVEIVTLANDEGIRVTCRDRGPGIADIDRALEPGFSTTGSMGRGLGGARRLVDEFSITSTPSTGTVVTLTGFR